ncbi:MAG: pilus assembly protein TadG-related protein [Chloroflexota bacterium]
MNFKHKFLSKLKSEESGQAIVIVAAALIVLIAFTGLAIDLGFVWMRQSQLKSIVDSAALAGAPLLGPTAAQGGLAEADKNAIQYLATNQIMDTNEGVSLDQLTSFESSQALSPLGAREYTITVTWEVPLFFMPVLGFEEWNLIESSTAAYFPLVDLYSGRRIALNGVTTSTQAIFGPDQVTSFGDAFSPDGSPFPAERGLLNADGDFSYIYRIEIPEDYRGYVTDPGTGERVETEIVRVELLDPDSINNSVPTNALLTHSRKFGTDMQNNGASPADLFQPVDEGDCSGNASNPCIILTCEWGELHEGSGRCRDGVYSNYYATNPDLLELDQINPFWFYRLDEMRRRSGTSQPNQTQYHTVTLYTLYYFQQESDGSIVKQFLTSYAGQSLNNADLTRWDVPPVGAYHTSTDLHWVSPGAYNEIGLVPTRCNTQNWPKNNGGFDATGGPADGCDVTVVGDEDPTATTFQDDATMGRGFEIDMSEDVTGILVDQVSRMKYIYLEIKTVEGASENGFEVWAGPPHAHYGLKSEVNDRNIQMTNDGNLYGTDGVSVYSLGIMPLNSLTNNRVDFPLVYVSPEYAGRDIEISLFDADAGTSYPMCFYFDTIPNPDCEPGFDTSMDGYLKYYDESNDSDGGRDRCFPRCNNQFVDPPFYVRVPDFTADCDPNNPPADFEERMENCNAFLGGRLMVSYDGGRHDTYQWLINFPSVPYIKE